MKTMNRMQIFITCLFLSLISRCIGQITFMEASFTKQQITGLVGVEPNPSNGFRTAGLVFEEITQITEASIRKQILIAWRVEWNPERNLVRILDSPIECQPIQDPDYVSVLPPNFDNIMNYKLVFFEKDKLLYLSNFSRPFNTGRRVEVTIGIEGGSLVDGKLVGGTPKTKNMPEIRLYRSISLVFSRILVDASSITDGAKYQTLKASMLPRPPRMNFIYNSDGTTTEGYTDETATAYVIGYACPPVWYDPITTVTINGVVYTLTRNMISAAMSKHKSSKPRQGGYRG